MGFISSMLKKKEDPVKEKGKSAYQESYEKGFVKKKHELGYTAGRRAARPFSLKVVEGAHDFVKATDSFESFLMGKPPTRKKHSKRQVVVVKVQGASSGKSKRRQRARQESEWPFL